MDKYSKLLSTHIFCPVAVETAGTWNGLAIELVQEIGRRITAITKDARETVFLFQLYVHRRRHLDSSRIN